MSELARTSALSRWFNDNGWRQVIIATPYLWLTVFFFIPFPPTIPIFFLLLLL